MGNPPLIHVAADEAALAQYTAQWIWSVAKYTLGTSDCFCLGLSGGRTPRQLYELLASQPDQMDWQRVHIYFADERCVGPDHTASNFGMVRRTLLEKVPVDFANVHRMRGEIEPERAAEEYDQLLMKQFPNGSGLDLVILGMGEDGHTASLFPQSPALAADTRLCAANHVVALEDWRLTLTAGFLNRTEHVGILVSGAAKSATLKRLLEEQPDPRQFPVRLIEPRSGNLQWLLDSAAAGMQ